MFEEKIDKLRDKLHSLIIEKADYNEVLKASQELDVYISQYTFNNLTDISNQTTVSEK